MQNRCLDRCPIPAGRFSKRGKMRIGLVLGQCPESPTERIHAKSECLRAGLANLLNLSPITIGIRHNGYIRIFTIPKRWQEIFTIKIIFKFKSGKAFGDRPAS